jgi:hypothetical protein
MAKIPVPPVGGKFYAQVTTPFFAETVGVVAQYF